MTTYEQVHSGAIVLGHDGALWGVERIMHEPFLAVTLVKGAERLTGYPPANTEITVVTPTDVAAEQVAVQALMDAFGSVELIAEHWERT